MQRTTANPIHNAKPASNTHGSCWRGCCGKSTSQRPPQLLECCGKPGGGWLCFDAMVCPCVIMGELHRGAASTATFISCWDLCCAGDYSEWDESYGPTTQAPQRPGQRPGKRKPRGEPYWCCWFCPPALPCCDTFGTGCLVGSLCCWMLPCCLARDATLLIPEQRLTEALCKVIRPRPTH